MLLLIAVKSICHGVEDSVDAAFNEPGVNANVVCRLTISSSATGAGDARLDYGKERNAGGCSLERVVRPCGEVVAGGHRTEGTDSKKRPNRKRHQPQSKHTQTTSDATPDHHRPAKKNMPAKTGGSARAAMSSTSRK